MGTSGSGLGLSVVYGIIKDHRGYYDIFSEVGKGTEFVFYLPASDEQPHVMQKTEQSLEGDATILVIDDDKSQRELTCQLLSSLGYKVHEAENGHHALDFLKENAVDLAVIDMIMETDFDGMDTYREIIKIHPTQKAIIVSGFSETGRVQTMQQLGAGEYIRKPFTLNRIGEAIKKALNSNEK